VDCFARAVDLNLVFDQGLEDGWNAIHLVNEESAAKPDRQFQLGHEFFVRL
jgi:hypothetical protein